MIEETIPSPNKRFRKKPVEIVAHRIGDDGWPDEIWEGVNRQEITLYLRTVNRKTHGHVLIKTLEGLMCGEVGDWIIRGVAGEFYPVKPAIFAATYEPAVSTVVREPIDRGQ